VLIAYTFFPTKSSIIFQAYSPPFPWKGGWLKGIVIPVACLFLAYHGKQVSRVQSTVNDGKPLTLLTDMLSQKQATGN